MQVSKPMGWKQGYTANRLLLIQSMLQRFWLVHAWSRGLPGLSGTSQGVSWCQHPRGVRDELLSKARHGLVLWY